MEKFHNMFSYENWSKRLNSFTQPYLHLLNRTLSIALRMIAISILFHFDSQFAREILHAISAVYLFQLIAGLEIYLNPKDSEKDHVSKILTMGVLVLPFVLFYFWSNGLSIFWLIFFFVDFLLIEISRKHNVNNKLGSSNVIVIKRSLVFLLASMVSLFYKVFFLPLLCLASVVLLYATLKKTRLSLSKIEKRSLLGIIKKVNIIAIALAIINRSFDLGIRGYNIQYDNFYYEFWDFFLSIFGIVNMTSFYLFIAPKAQQILNGNSSVTKKAYLVQPLIVLAAMLVGFVYFSLLKGFVSEFDQQGMVILMQIYLFSVIMALFQIDSWRILKITRKNVLSGTNQLLSSCLFIAGFLGLYLGLVESMQYGLYGLVVLVFFSMLLPLSRWKNV